MKKILVINSCVNRGTSRTVILKDALVEKLRKSENYDVDELILENIHLVPLTSNLLNTRNELAGNSFSGDMFSFAHQLADADLVVVAAPYWDFSFPAMLKTYLEYTTVTNLTFRYNDLGVPVGMCKAEKLYYVTTSGGSLGKNLGYEYVKELFTMYGINNSTCISAENLDVIGADVQVILGRAISAIKL